MIEHLAYLASILATLTWTFHDWNVLGLDETGAVPTKDLRGDLPRKHTYTRGYGRSGERMYVTTSGPYKGGRYQLFTQDGKHYKRYENGSVVLIGNPNTASIGYPPDYRLPTESETRRQTVEEKWINAHSNAIGAMMRVINGR